MKPIFLKPVIKHILWGGTKLRDVFGYQEEGSDLAECWGISAHAQGDCQVLEGDLQGKTLSELWKSYPEVFGKTKEETDGVAFPLLVKVIDAKDNLSIQVHPDDAYARAAGDDNFGKTECWYILDCEEGSEIVIGHNANTKEELETMIRAGQWDQLIGKIQVKPGDFIQINPGMVHAITGGITILETQQNSAVTYRVYDYDRKVNGQLRELHVEKSIDVITVPGKVESDLMFNTNDLPSNTVNTLYRCQYYDVFEIKVDGAVSVQNPGPYMLMSVAAGQGSIDGKEIKIGDHFILPNDVKEVKLEGNMKIIASTEGKS